MWAHIPVLGWMIAAFFSGCLSIPLWFLWNKLAPIYFYWLPGKYLSLPFLHVVGLVLLMSIFRHLFYPHWSVHVENKAEKT